jgi:hypothetical protein
MVDPIFTSKRLTLFSLLFDCQVFDGFLSDSLLTPARSAVQAGHGLQNKPGTWFTLVLD